MGEQRGMTTPRRILHVWVPGQPKGQPRPRAFVRVMGGRPVARVYDAGTAEGWKSAIAAAVRPSLPREPIGGPLALHIVFLMPRPKSLMRKSDPDGSLPHLARPDLDNMEKACLDALTAIGLWRDDAHVCQMSSSKVYHAKAGRPGAWITVSVPGEESEAVGLFAGGNHAET